MLEGKAGTHIVKRVRRRGGLRTTRRAAHDARRRFEEESKSRGKGPSLMRRRKRL